MTLSRAVSLVILSFLVAPLTLAREIDSRGTYIGVFQSTQHPGLVGSMTFVISDVKNHRFMGAVITLSGGGVSVPFVVDGTVSTSGEFTGNGSGVGGKVQFHGQIMFLDGGAAIANATYFLMPMGNPPPEPDRGNALLVRGFPAGGQVPLVGGPWNGMATSPLGQTTFHLDITQGCNGNMPSTMFSGFELVGGALNFMFDGTINSDGQFLAVAGDFTNDQVIIMGQYKPPNPSTESTATVTGDYVLMFANGFTDRGTFTVGQVGSPPDPCNIINTSGP